MTGAELKEALQPVADALHDIASAIRESSPGAGSGRNASPRGTGRVLGGSSSNPSGKSSEPRVRDVVLGAADTAWGSVTMPFTKQRGTALSDLSVGLVEWLADNWEPKGYSSDSAIQDCIDATLRAVGGGSSSKATPAVETKGAATQPAEESDTSETFDDVPF